MTKRVLLTLAVLAGNAAARDWAKYPAVVEIEGAAEIFAIGDAHGDYSRLAQAMKAAGIIDKGENWIAGHAVLVSTGDMIDKGPRALDVIRLLMKLRSAAPDQGGRVVLLAGNHEAEFMADSGAAKGKQFADQLRGAGNNPKDVASCKGDIGAFLCTLPFAARVNDTFFSHAGNSGGRSLAQIERDIRMDFDAHGFAAEQLVGDGSVMEARLNGTGKGRDPWIDAGLPGRAEKTLLSDYTRALGVSRIVQGHVPSAVTFKDGVARNPGEMFQRFGMLFLIDTGMSEGVDDSVGAVFRIAPGNGGLRAIAICPNGSQSLLWDAATGQDSGRAAPCRK